MHPFLQKTFCGLTAQYYFRQLFFGALFASFFVFMSLKGNASTSVGSWVFVVFSAFLYPYSRFVYESIVGFIMGDNVFFVNAIFMLIAKLFTMALCFSFAIFIAPVGLAYLYIYHTKNENKACQEQPSEE